MCLVRYAGEYSAGKMQGGREGGRGGGREGGREGGRLPRPVTASWMPMIKPKFDEYMSERMA
jgi:hypothetical protein